MDIYFMGYNLILFYFVAQILSSWNNRALFQLAPVSLSCALMVFFVFESISLIPGTARCSWHIVYFLLGTSSVFSIPVLKSPISPFSKKTWFFFLDNSIRNQDIGIRFVHCYWDVTDSRPSQLMDQRNICVYTVSIHLSIDISANWIILIYFKLNIS